MCFEYYGVLFAVCKVGRKLGVFVRLAADGERGLVASLVEVPHGLRFRPPGW